MLTVMHVTAPANFGGLERVVSGLCVGASRRGYQIILVMALTPGTPAPDWSKELVGEGVRVIPLSVPKRAYWTEQRYVRNLAMQLNVDLIHSHGYRSDLLHLSSARRVGIPVISTAHGFSATDLAGYVYQRLQLRAWRNFDAVVAVSRPLFGMLLAAGVPRPRLRTVANGMVGSPVFLPRADARTALGLADTDVVFGWVGRFSAEKNPRAAIEALHQLADPRIKLVMVGDGPLLENCQLHANDLGLGRRIQFTGAKSNAASLFLAFDALVLSSRTEGTPMVLLEAAMASVPIVATHVGGVPDLIAGDGILVPQESATALAEGMRQVILDPSAAALRSAALNRRLSVDSHSGDWIDAYVDIYREMTTPSRVA